MKARQFISLAGVLLALTIVTLSLLHRLNAPSNSTSPVVNNVQFSQQGVGEKPTSPALN